VNLALSLAFLFTAFAAATLGWMAACSALARDAADLADSVAAEREALDEERQQLSRLWLQPETAQESRIEFALGAHKKPRVVS